MRVCRPRFFIGGLRMGVSQLVYFQGVTNCVAAGPGELGPGRPTYEAILPRGVGWFLKTEVCKCLDFPNPLLLFSPAA